MTATELFAIRKATLLSLIKAAGSQATVARKIGTNRSYVSQIVSTKGSRNVGDALARKIENAYGHPFGWMDEPHVWGPGEDGPHSDFVLIPRIRAEASMGVGAECPAQDDIIGHLAFKNVWLQKRRLNPRFLTIIDAVGDSMKPTINDGDVLLVDLRQKDPIDNRIFVLRMDQQLYAKRLQNRPGGKLAVHSDNPHAPAFDVELSAQDGLDIIGRVVWAGRDL
ncbi:MAG: helix-turn-helix transcriptional regulator [Magnetococcales bacterium]|nr:helix-turn-helix transcriptional regulator [Magnetococcales bacterium]